MMTGYVSFEQVKMSTPAGITWLFIGGVFMFILFWKKQCTHFTSTDRHLKLTMQTVLILKQYFSFSKNKQVRGSTCWSLSVVDPPTYSPLSENTDERSLQQ